MGFYINRDGAVVDLQTQNVAGANVRIRTIVVGSSVEACSHLRSHIVPVGVYPDDLRYWRKCKDCWRMVEEVRPDTDISGLDRDEEEE